MDVSAREARRFSGVLGTGKRESMEILTKSMDSDLRPVELIARIGEEYVNAITESD